MTWANARDVDLMDDITDTLQEQALHLAAHGASAGELQKVKKVGALRLKLSAQATAGCLPHVGLFATALSGS